jgi:hypothetical protein
MYRRSYFYVSASVYGSATRPAAIGSALAPASFDPNSLGEYDGILCDPEKARRLAFALKVQPHEVQARHDRARSVALDRVTELVESTRCVEPARVVRPVSGREDHRAETPNVE